MSETPLTKTTLDRRALRVLAHPLRARLLSELRREGPATATALAQALDTNTGATSYHLRKLAEVGLVEETGGGVGRERVWRAAHDMHSFRAGDFVGDQNAEAALDWLQGEYFRSYTECAGRWAADQAQWPVEWRDAAGMSDYLLDLTPAELRQMQQELYAVVERYRVAAGTARRPVGDPDPARRRVLFYMHAFPDTRSHP